MEAKKEHQEKELHRLKQRKSCCSEDIKVKLEPITSKLQPTPIQFSWNVEGHKLCKLGNPTSEVLILKISSHKYGQFRPRLRTKLSNGTEGDARFFKQVLKPMSTVVTPDFVHCPGMSASTLLHSLLIIANRSSVANALLPKPTWRGKQPPACKIKFAPARECPRAFHAAVDCFMEHLPAAV